MKTVVRFPEGTTYFGSEDHGHEIENDQTDCPQCVILATENGHFQCVDVDDEEPEPDPDAGQAQKGGKKS